MSEHRYFEYNDGSGDVFMTGDREAMDYVGRPDGFTEVQVVSLDAIVIRREELPEVKTETWPDGRVMLHAVTEPDLTYGPTEKQADRARKYAYAELAVAEAIEAHLREHPPVDEGQVKALAEMLANDYNSRIGKPDGAGYHYGGAVKMAGEFRDKARRLVRRGVRVADEP